MHFTSRTTSCVIGLTWALAGCSQSSGLPTSFHPLDPRAAAYFPGPVCPPSAQRRVPGDGIHLISTISRSPGRSNFVP